MQEQGWLTHYTNTRYGEGLLPDTYEAFRKQRNRWAYGGFQIVKKHWRRFLPGASRLTPEQRREFSLGWLNWLGAESLGVVVAILNLIWVPIVVFAEIAIPDKILTLPIIASFVVSLTHFVALYRLRVKVKAGQMLGAMIAAMSVQWTVSRAVAQGLITDHMPFARTSKGGLSRMSIEFQAFWEAVIGVLLLIGAALLVVNNNSTLLTSTGAKQVREIYIFAGVLVLESLPFLSAVAIAILENSRINEFAFWRNSAVRAAELIGLRPVSLPKVVPKGQFSKTFPKVMPKARPTEAQSAARTTYAAEDQANAQVLDIPDARVWGDGDTDFARMLPTTTGPWLAFAEWITQ
jgi:hypothetical protein